MNNRNFGKLDAENRIVYAPVEVKIDGKITINPTAEHYAAAGWLPVIDEKPTDKAGVYYIAEGWKIRTDEQTSASAIYRTYREEPLAPPAPHVTRYSKLKLIVAAKAAGKWEAIKAFIAQAGYEDEWTACQFLSSDYAQFNVAKEAIIEAGVANAEEIEAILAESVDEEMAA